MSTLFPLLLATIVGFTHAFEVDHLLAVSNIVTRRKSVWASVKDGIFWGLGHTSTIMIVGILMIVVRVAITQRTFGYFEACVGLMLVVLGGHRLWKGWRHNAHAHDHHHPHDEPDGHGLAYGVGLVHGLAGSGTLVLLVMTQLRSSWEGIVYLFIFGLGSIAGMLVASGVFSLPFSKKIQQLKPLRMGLTLLSSVLCMGFGMKVIWINLM
ncbi:MAG TPA: sulfite exporter TauE/SafE family protein [Saprospiraceae bacterium]|nr:sulfite exporter TauE/SafE family protein [Saprospiraceae bacterium]